MLSMFIQLDSGFWILDSGLPWCYTVTQVRATVRALASLCPHDGIYMGVIAPELIVGFCTDPVVLGTLRLPPWHTDRNSACSGSLHRQLMISSCRVAIAPHTTTLNWLSRCTNSGDISITRSALTQFYFTGRQTNNHKIKALPSYRLRAGRISTAEGRS